MSKSVLSRPTVTKSQDRNPFDNSCFRNWHQSLGMLIPVFCKAFPAGTKGSFNRFAFTRTKKVLYPAFQGVHECIDVFKVPIRLLWSQWNDWKLNINDLNSSSLVSAAVDGSGNFSADLNQPSIVLILVLMLMPVLLVMLHLSVFLFLPSLCVCWMLSVMVRKLFFLMFLML